MKIHCSIYVVNRLLPPMGGNMRRKPCKSTLAICKHPNNDSYFLILFLGQSKTGTKYMIKDNIVKVLGRFIQEGKCTIQLKKPEHDLCIQGDPIQIKSFVHMLAKASTGQNECDTIKFSSLSVTPINQNVAPTKMIITTRSDYPSKGLPRTLESLHVNDIERMGFNTTRMLSKILQLNKLKVLNLSNNSLHYLPEELNKLPNLKELNVSHNKLSQSTPKQWQWLGNCLLKSLTLLDLTYNELTYIPDQIVKLQNLATLQLSNNLLKTLPVGIGSLRNLKVFSASNNCLTFLPGSIKKLKLQSIDLSNNEFAQSIPNREENGPKNLKVCSLKEYAAKKVLSCRIPYPKGSLPLTVIDFLDYAKYCVCGKACFSVYLRHSHSLLLSTISETINTVAGDSIFVPIDCYFCSLKCLGLVFFNRARPPLVR